MNASMRQNEQRQTPSIVKSFESKETMERKETYRKNNKIPVLFKQLNENKLENSEEKNK